MICPICGKEIADDSKTCEYCGVTLVDPTDDEQEAPKPERHGFITFWLWLIAILNGVAGLVLLAGAAESGYYDSMVRVMIIFTGVLSLLHATGAGLLLAWKKAGFYLIICVAVLSLFFSILTGVMYEAWGETFRSIISSVVSPIILWFILNIKKNDVPYWELMH